MKIFHKITNEFSKAENFIYFKLLFISFLCYYSYLNILFQKYYRLKRSPKDVFSPHKVFIESHRGVNKEIFENTMESFKKAIDYNIEAIETDVWLSQDNELVIVHGGGQKGNLSQFYGIEGNVTDFTWEELSTFRTINDSLPMPKLKDVFKLAKNKIFINLEIKDRRIDLVFPYIIQEIENFDFFDQICLSSFNDSYYEKVQEYNKNNDKNIVFGKLYSKRKGENEYNYTRKGSLLNLYWMNITKEICNKAHENGMAVLAFFEMNDTETDEIYQKLIENGVDVICCNDPLLAKIYRDNYYIKSNISKFFLKIINKIRNFIIKYK